MYEVTYVPFNSDDIELILKILNDYLRYYDIKDAEPFLDRDDIEDLMDYFIEIRQKYFECDEEDDSCE